MNALPQLALSFLGLLFCVGDVALLAWLLEWRARASSPDARWQRLLRIVLPATLILLALLLAAFTQLMLLWSGQ